MRGQRVAPTREDLITQSRDYRINLTEHFLKFMWNIFTERSVQAILIIEYYNVLLIKDLDGYLCGEKISTSTIEGRDPKTDRL